MRERHNIALIIYDLETGAALNCLNEKNRRVGPAIEQNRTDRKEENHL